MPKTFRPDRSWYVSMHADGKMYFPAAVLAAPVIAGAKWLTMDYMTHDDAPCLRLRRANGTGLPCTPLSVRPDGAATLNVGWSPWQSHALPVPYVAGERPPRFTPVVVHDYLRLQLADAPTPQAAAAHSAADNAQMELPESAAGRTARDGLTP